MAAGVLAKLDIEINAKGFSRATANTLDKISKAFIVLDKTMATLPKTLRSTSEALGGMTSSAILLGTVLPGQARALNGYSRALVALARAASAAQASLSQLGPLPTIPNIPSIPRIPRPTAPKALLPPKAAAPDPGLRGYLGLSPGGVTSGVSVATPSMGLMATAAAAQLAYSAVSSLAGAYINAGQAALQAGIAFDSVRATLLAVTGSQAAANIEFDYVKKVAMDMAIPIRDAATQYSRLMAAAGESPKLRESAKQAFEGVAVAARVLNLSGEQVGGTIEALVQVMSKGKLQAEELRKQLGNRIPGAFRLAAEAMGMTTAQLDEALKKGQVSSTKFIESFGAALQKAYGGGLGEALGSLGAQLVLLENKKDLLGDIITKAGLGAGAKEAVSGVSAALGQLMEEWERFNGTVEGASFRVAMRDAGKAAGELAGKLLEMFSNISQSEGFRSLLKFFTLISEGAVDVPKAWSSKFDEWFGDKPNFLGQMPKKGIASEVPGMLMGAFSQFGRSLTNPVGGAITFWDQMTGGAEDARLEQGRIKQEHDNELAKIENNKLTAKRMTQQKQLLESAKKVGLRKMLTQYGGKLFTQYFPDLRPKDVSEVASKLTPEAKETVSDKATEKAEKKRLAFLHQLEVGWRKIELSKADAAIEGAKDAGIQGEQLKYVSERIRLMTSEMDFYKEKVKLDKDLLKIEEARTRLLDKRVGTSFEGSMETTGGFSDSFLYAAGKWRTGEEENKTIKSLRARYGKDTTAADQLALLRSRGPEAFGTDLETYYKAIEDLSRRSNEVYGTVRRATEDLAQSFGESLVASIWEGNKAWEDFGQTALKMLAKLITQLMIVDPLMKSLGGGAGGNATGWLGRFFSGFGLGGGGNPAGGDGVTGELVPSGMVSNTRVGKAAPGGQFNVTIHNNGEVTAATSTASGASAMTREMENVIVAVVAKHQRLGGKLR